MTSHLLCLGAHNLRTTKCKCTQVLVCSNPIESGEGLYTNACLIDVSQMGVVSLQPGWRTPFTLPSSPFYPCTLQPFPFTSQALLPCQKTVRRIIGLLKLTSLLFLPPYKNRLHFNRQAQSVVLIVSHLIMMLFRPTMRCSFATGINPGRFKVSQKNMKH